MSPYPADAVARDRYVLTHRPQRSAHDPWRSQGVIVEDERMADGSVGPVGTIFLTGRECPWRCVMCDLWMHTTTSDTPAGAIPKQIRDARLILDEPASAISALKLYNAGSFFDPRAVPEIDYDAIGDAVAPFGRVIVESHPSLVGTRTERFIGILERFQPGARLEVAMGLETAHPDALERLHKRMTVDGFMRAADALRALGADLRVFLLVSPPFVPRDEQDHWLRRSLTVAFEAGATAVSLIPTRSGNGALDALALENAEWFRPPRLADLERSLDLGLGLVGSARCRVFADLWDLERFSDCAHCLSERRERLRRMNVEQRTLPTPQCAHCDSSDARR